MWNRGYPFQVCALVVTVFVTHTAITSKSAQPAGSKIGVVQRTELIPVYHTEYKNQVHPPTYSVFREDSDPIENEEDFEYADKDAVPEIFVHGSELRENKEGIPSEEFTLHLIGERHSGTKWMVEHLEECFGKLVAVKVQPRFTRWKHWFQDDESFRGMGKKAIVIAQFRNPYEWVKAMNNFPYHSPEHLELPWLEFVNRPWYMNPYGKDIKATNLTSYHKGDKSQEAPCQGVYFPNEVVPCLEVREDIIVSKGLSRPYSIHPLYELNRDGTGNPYKTVLELRAAKIRNFVNMTEYEHVHHFEAVKYEGLATHGTKDLVERIEKVLGHKAQCQPSEGKFNPRPLQRDLVEYLNKHMDWEAERMIGYDRLDPALMKNF